MTTRQLLVLHRASPFIPFVLFITDGRAIEVPNIECFGLAENEVSFMLFQPPELLEIIEPMPVVSIQFYEPQELRRPRP